MLRRKLARAERRRARKLGLAGVASGALATGLAFASPSRATTVNETTDFGDTFATRTLLPDGTDVVNGAVQFTVEPPFFIETPDLDFFAFTDLVPGASFSLDVTNAFGDAALIVSVLDGAGVSLFSSFVALETTQNFAGSVPVSGELGLRLLHGQDVNAYTVALDAPRVPEPGSAALLGTLALGARSFLRRRRV